MMLRNIALTAQRELRILLRSPAALLFIGLFLVACYIYVFNSARFFARNLADVRPLFAAQPLLLIFLTAALTMRMWAEERRARSAELLATLPIHEASLVIGKFLSALALVSLALVLTAPFPLMVASVAQLDTGPVFGGYLAALLLASFYIALGIFVSAMTASQVVALLLSMAIGSAFYLIGDLAQTEVMPSAMVESLARISTAAHFESIERGVFDLRDVVFYLSGTCAFLAMNVVALRLQRIDLRRRTSGRRALGLFALAALVLANVLLLNLWVEEVPGARLDLTETQQYRIESVTRQTLQHLEEELRIEALISDETHPQIAPLVPEVRDMLREYESLSGGRLRVRFIDPLQDREAARQASEELDISSVPMRVQGRNRDSVVDVWFHLVLRYGTQTQVLSMDQLLETDTSGPVERVRLRNLEFDLTRAIRRLTRRFQSIDALLESHRTRVNIRLLASPALPEDLQAALDVAREAGLEVSARHQMVSFEELNPLASIGGNQTWVDRYNLLPTVSSATGTESYFFELLIDNGEIFRRVPPFNFQDRDEASARLENAIQGLYPGRLTRVGLFAPTSSSALALDEAPPGLEYLYRFLDEQFRVETVELSTGAVPEQIDVLLVVAPRILGERDLFAIDQFAMRGGPVIILAGGRVVSAAAGRLSAEDTDPALVALLRTWGVEMDNSFVLDPRSAPFPTTLAPFRFLDDVPTTYPYFVDARGDELNAEHPVTADLANLTLPWASPLELHASGAGRMEVLARSSQRSRTTTSYDVYPDAPRTVTEAPSLPLAVALTGPLTSHFAGRDVPLAESERLRSLDSSVETARVVVVSSSNLVSDLILSLSEDSGGVAHQNNLVFLSNLLDWAGQDEELLAIRAAGTRNATLPAFENDEQRRLKRRVWFPALLALLLIGILPQLAFRLQRPSRRLAPRDRRGHAPGGEP